MRSCWSAATSIRRSSSHEQASCHSAWYRRRMEKRATRHWRGHAARRNTAGGGGGGRDLRQPSFYAPVRGRVSSRCPSVRRGGGERIDRLRAEWSATIATVS